MEKTKRQLRAEAVERLKECRHITTIDLALAAVGWGHEMHTADEFKTALINLLKNDDMDSAVSVQKCPNDELQEGDAVMLLRDWLDYKINRFDAEANAIILNTGADPDKLYEIADMVERDYVLAENYSNLALLRAHAERERDELQRELDIANVKLLGKPKCELCDRTTLLTEIDGLTAERDELRAKYDKDVLVIVDELDRWKTRAVKLETERDEWKVKAEQAERAMNRAAGKWANADADNRELRKMLLLDNGTVEDYTERADPLKALAYQKQLAEEWRDRCHNAEAWCDKLESERDEWKAKAEAKSAKRAAAVEWLRRYQDEELTTKGYTAKVEYPLDELIDLLTDDDANDDSTPKNDVNAGDVDANDGKAISENLRKSQDSEIESCGQYADQPKREEAPDCENDSREKLEADVRKHYAYSTTTLMYPPSANKTTDMLRSLPIDTVVGWLDRQASIDERYWKSQVDALVSKGEMLADENTRLWNEIAEQQANLNRANDDFQSARAELEGENAELTEQLEAAHAKNRALKAHISKMQEGRHGWHIKAAKLQAQVDKLTAECGECVYKQEFASIDELQMKVDALTQANSDYREEWHRVCAERDKLNRELHACNRERERLRKSLGIAIDHAYDMIALVSLDGDAE